MRLNKNICIECGEKNFTDSEYHIPLSICNGCFEKKQKDMFQTINNLQEQATKLDQEKVEASANTQQNIKKQNKDSRLIKSLLVLGIVGGIIFYFIKTSEIFHDNQTGLTWHDNQTGLTWQDNSDVQTVQKDWNVAKEYCANLTIGEYSDWRLPSYNELLTIVDYSTYNPAIKSGFKNVAFSNYWSSIEAVSDDSNVWYVNFSDGSSGWDVKLDKDYVRCVRGK